MSTDRDVERIVRSWMDEGATQLPERVLDAVLDQLPATPQRRSWPAWRTFRMNKLALTAATAATVLVVTVVGYNLLPGLGIVGPGATPSPSPALLARGNFVTGDGVAVELEATGEGSSVTGRMTVSDEGWSFTVDLQCTRTTEDGLIMIGGVTTDTTGDGSVLSPEGTRAGIFLKRGSPVGAGIWSQRGGPTSRAASCLAFLDEQLLWDLSTHPDGEMSDPIEGTVELGP